MKTVAALITLLLSTLLGAVACTPDWQSAGTVGNAVFTEAHGETYEFTQGDHRWTESYDLDSTWQLYLENDRGSSWIYVSEAEFTACPIGSHYPDCYAKPSVQ